MEARTLLIGHLAKSPRRTIARVRHWLRPDIRIVAAMAITVLLLAVGAASVHRELSDHLLRADAEATALAWAENLRGSLGDELGALLNRRAPSEATIEKLEAARRIGGVFRFKLFDSNGDLVLVSEDLNGSPIEIERSLAAHRGGDGVATRVLGGQPHVETRHGTPPHRPLFYAEAYVPLWAAERGEVIGVAEAYVDQAAKHTMFDRAFAIAGMAVALLVLLAALPPAWLAHRRSKERRNAEAKVRFLAHHDALTHLPNRERLREAFDTALARSRRDGTPVAVLAIDLDRFKEVNDAFGHAAGDALLRVVAERLRATTRQGDDIVARLGGDEFVVVQVGTNQPDGAGRLAERIVAVLGEPYELESGRAVCGASVGIAIGPVDGETVDQLLGFADAALYRAKADGRGAARFFEPRMDAALRARRNLERDLRVAVHEQHFTLQFQPLQSLPHGTLAGFEALLRWTHPERGPISPAEFVPLAEETGLIVPLGAWVIEEACRQATGWPDDVCVAVNLSPIQFRHGDIVATVAAALTTTGLPAHRLELEVTEGLLLRDTEAVIATLQALRRLGVSIAMDDFGTGYSSLAYLWRFPFDKLKIDRSFVSGMQRNDKAATIVQSVVALGRGLGLTVTAEGVETEAEANALRDMGCDLGQGWLLGRPIASESVAAWLRDRPAATAGAPAKALSGA